MSRAPTVVELMASSTCLKRLVIDPAFLTDPAHNPRWPLADRKSTS